MTSAARLNVSRLVFCPAIIAALLTLGVSAEAQNAPSDTTSDNGTHWYGSYDGVHENISTSSGNLSFCIPLVSLKGPNHHDVNIPLCYNSQFQEQSLPGGGVVQTGDTLSFFPWTWAPNTPSGDTTPPMGVGWSLTGFAAEYASPATSPSGYPVEYMPDGGKYGFPMTGGTGPDGQNADSYLLNYAMQMPGSTNLSHETFIMKDGTRYYVSTSGGTPVCASWGCAEEFFPDSGSSPITWTSNSVTDLVGRAVTESSGSTFSGSNTTSSTAYIQFQYPASSGTATVQVQMTTMQFNCTSNDPGYHNSYDEVGSGGVLNSQGQYVQAWGPYSMPTAIILPNGLNYTFQYDNCGMIRKVTYPSGGYTRYDYSAQRRVYINCNGTGNACGSQYYVNEISAKHVCSAASGSLTAALGESGFADTCSASEETTLYSPTVPYGVPAGGANSQMTVTDPVGNYVVYQFSSPNDTVTGIPALETSRAYYNASGALLKTVTTQYSTTTSPGSTFETTGGAVPPGDVDSIPALPTIQTTTLDNGQVSQIQWSYNFYNSTDSDSVLTEERVYDYAQGAPGGLLKKTDYTWLHRDNPTAYGWGTTNGWAVTAHICDRKTSETVYDGGGKLLAQTKYVYDGGNPSANGAYGLLTSVSKWRSSDGSWLTTNYQYGAYGNVTQATDPNSNVTQYSYTDNYADGINRNSLAFLTKTTDPLGYKTYSQYYWGSGLVAASCGENFTSSCVTGLSTGADYASYTYDILGRKTSTTTGDGGQTTTCFSELGGSGCSASGSYPLQVTSTEVIASGVNKVSEVTLDGEARNVRSQLNSDPGCSGGTVNVDTTYDADERKSTVTNPYCSTNSGAPTSGTTTYTYDGLSRVIQVTHPDSTYASNTYTGRAVLSADEGNGTDRIQRISQSDALGRLIYVCEITGQTQQGTSNKTPSSCGLDVTGTGFLTTYGYDASNSNGPLESLTSVTQGGVTRSFIYDSLGELLTATNPESGVTTYSYDKDGNLQSKIAPLENSSSGTVTTSYAYDKLNRLLSKSYSDGVTPSACFEYDTTTHGTGRLATEWTQTGTCPSAPPSSGILTERTFAAYDLLGRVATDEQCSALGNCGSSFATLGYSYDLAGDIISFNNGMSGSSALPFTSQYNSAGRLSQVSGLTSPGGQNTSLFTSAVYTPAGALSNASIGTGSVPGITFQRSYNSRLLPTSEVDTVARTPGTATVQVSGAEQLSAYSSGSITFSGSEQCSGSTCDSGTYLVTIGASPSIPVTYGQTSTPSTLASSLAALISCTNDNVQAVSNGATVSLQSCSAGTNNDYSITVTPDGHSSSFSSYSFSATTSGSTMTPIMNPTTLGNAGVAIAFGTTGSGQIGTGMFTALVYPAAGGNPVFSGNLTWSSSDTTSTLASRLAALIGSCTGSGVVMGALADGPSVYLVSCQSGTSYILEVVMDYSNGSAGFKATATNTPASAVLPTVTFSGTEEGGQTGTFLVNAVGSQGSHQTVSVNWGTGGTPTTLASSLASGLGSCSSNGNGMTGVASGSTVYLDPCQPSATYTISAYVSGCSCSSNNPPDFAAIVTTTPPTGALPPVRGAIFDSGTVTLTVNGSQVATASYGANSTLQAIASALATNGANNPLVQIAVSGDSLTLTAIGDGSVTDYSYAVTGQSSQPSYFGIPSFAGSPGSGDLAGGTNAALYNWSISSYAPNGDVLGMTDSVMGTWTYAYDDFNRLASGTSTAGVDSGLALGWTYDRYGNRWTQSATGTGNASAVQPNLSFTGNNNRVDGWSYDAAGNLLNDGRNGYAYDAEGRIISLNGHPTYLYDAEGRRVAKYSGSTITASYLLDLGGNQVTELNSSGSWVHTNVFAGGRLQATYEGTAGPSPNTWHFHLTDWLGTNRMQTTAAGNQEEVCYSYPFGDGLLCSGTDATEHHFTGKERDAESGLDYFGARYLTTDLGRWMTPDPGKLTLKHLINPQKWDKFNYVLNNPLAMIDPDGQQELWIQFRAFIPQSNVGYIGKGDGRSFSKQESANSRVSITMHVETDPAKNGGKPLLGYTVGINQTHNNLTNNDTPAVVVQAPTPTASQDSTTGQVTLNVQMNVHSGDLPAAMAIRSNVNIDVNEAGTEASVSGTTSVSPAFEANIAPQGGPTTNIPVQDASEDADSFMEGLLSDHQVNTGTQTIQQPPQPQDQQHQ
jgi:RHS repeat-associated protein